MWLILYRSTREQRSKTPLGHRFKWYRPYEAKFDEEANFEVRFAVARPKPRQIDENQISRAEIFVQKNFSVSKNKTSGIFRNSFWQGFAAIGALFET